METSLMVISEYTSSKQRDVIVGLLSEETRPSFEDEVPIEYQTAFNIIDNLEYPDWLKKHTEKSIQMMWSLGGWDFEEETSASLKDLMSAGAENVIAYLSLEDDEHIFIMGEGGKTVVINNWDKASLDAIDVDDMESIFHYIDNLKKDTVLNID